MPKEIIHTVNKVDVVHLPDGETIENYTGELLYEVVKAAPNTDPTNFYLRMQYMGGDSYKWGGNIDDWNDQIPENDNRWVKE